MADLKDAESAKDTPAAADLNATSDGTEPSPLTVPATEFTRFLDLPPELRLMVWNYALPGPRNVHLWQAISNDRLLLLTSANHPTLLSINHESRNLALQHYSMILGPNNFSLALDFKRDRISVMTPNSIPPPYGVYTRGPTVYGSCEYAPYNTIPARKAGEMKFVFTAYAENPDVTNASSQVELRSLTLKSRKRIGLDVVDVLNTEWEVPTFESIKGVSEAMIASEKYNWRGCYPPRAIRTPDITLVSWVHLPRKKFGSEIIEKEHLRDGQHDVFCVADERDLFPARPVEEVEEEKKGLSMMLRSKDWKNKDQKGKSKER